MLHKLLVVSVIVTMTILIRFLERTRRMSDPTKRIHSNANLLVFYECLNLHSCLSLGMLALAWGMNYPISHLVVLFILVLFGVTSKASFSWHKPNCLLMIDLDAKYGLWLPNMFSLTAIGYLVTSSCDTKLVNEIILLLVAILASYLIVCFMSTYTDRFLDNFLARKDLVFARDFRNFIALVTQSRKRPLTTDETKQLHSLVMTISMQARSPRGLRPLFDQALKVICKDNEILVQEVNIILTKRL